MVRMAPSSSKVSKSPIKRLSKDLKPIFSKRPPVLKSLLTASQNASSLVIIGHDAKLECDQCFNPDILHVIEGVVVNRWAELSRLHDRYHALETKLSSPMSDLVFLLSGLNMNAKADAVRFRTSQMPSCLVTLSILYAIYRNQGHTFVDRMIEKRVSEGVLRRFVIFNASPVIPRNQSVFLKSSISYGAESVEVVCKQHEYLEVIDKHIQVATLKKKSASLSEERTAAIQCDALAQLRAFICENPNAIYLKTEGQFLSEHLSQLVTLGFTTLSSNHLNEIEAHQYAISSPGCGSYLRLVNACRAWLVAQLNKLPHHECLEGPLHSRWAGEKADGSSKMNCFRKPYFGYDLVWILADALGAGVVEVFKTPQGNAWRLTGKV